MSGIHPLMDFMVGMENSGRVYLYCDGRKIIYRSQKWKQRRRLDNDSEDSSEEHGCEDNQIDKVDMSKDSDFDIFYDYKKEKTEILDAIQNGQNIDVIIDYLPHRFIDNIDARQNTCLQIAVGISPYNMCIIKELLKRGSKINKKDWKGNTALHLAAKNPSCDVELVRVLLEGGANPNMRNKDWDTPLHMFIMRCCVHSDVGKNAEMIKLLLIYGAKPNIRNKFHFPSIYMGALAEYCDWTVLEELIKHGANINLLSGNIGKVSVLHKTVQTSSECTLGKVKYLLRLKPNFVKWKDFGGRTPLHHAMLHGANVLVIKELINGGADVNARDYNENTPLHYSRACTYSAVVTLVRYGADINARNKGGNTPLMKVAFEHPNVGSMAALIAAGSNLEGRDMIGKSALQHAMERNVTEVVGLLLENGANPANVNFIPPATLYRVASARSILLYLQFIILHKLGDVEPIPKPDTLLNLDLEDPRLHHFLRKFRNDCITELKQMKTDWLVKNNFSLYSHLWECICQRRASSLPPAVIRELLSRIKQCKYPHCIDLLYASMRRKHLIDYLSLQNVYSSAQTDKGPQVVLDYGSISYLGKFLHKGTLLNLIEVFAESDCILDPQKVYTGINSTHSSIDCVGNKRKHEETETVNCLCCSLLKMM